MPELDQINNTNDWFRHLRWQHRADCDWLKLPGKTLLMLALLLLIASVVQAETTPAASPTPVDMRVQGVTSSKADGHVGMEDWLTVDIANLDEAIQKDKLNPADFVLYLDGRPIKCNKALLASGQLAFQLKRTDESREAWSSLLGRPSIWNNLKSVTVSVGLPDSKPIRFKDDKAISIKLRVYYQRWLVAVLIFVVIAIIGFVFLAKTTGVIRDSNPPKPEVGKRKPYSLALIQAAWWFFLVIGSFLFIYLITGDYNTITDQALILMGIGTGTALGAAMIDATKRDSSNTALSTLEPEKARLEAEITELKKTVTEVETKIAGAGGVATDADNQMLSDARASLQEKTAKLAGLDNQVAEARAGLSKPTSEGFIKDLLTDVDGVNLHRFQMVVWTLVLGFLFCAGVYKELAMPAFSGTLLALMGISSGTYLGFKIPEKHN